MKKYLPVYFRLLLIGMISMSSFLAWSQSKTQQVTVDMLKSMTYDKDPEAPAVILYDIGKTEFMENATGQFEIHFTRKVRIKIFDRDAYNLGDVTIPLYVGDASKKESVDIRKAVTYSLEGDKIKTIPLDQKLIYTEKRSKNWTVKKFAMPQISAGSIIEFEYKLRSPFLFNLPSWRFQHTVPVVWSEYTAAMIPYFNYLTRHIGINAFDVAEKKSDNLIRRFHGKDFTTTNHRWVMTDVPAFKEEPFMTSEDDYISKVTFQLYSVNYPDEYPRMIMESWDKVAQTLMKDTDFGHNLRERVYKNELDAMTAVESEPLVLAKMIYKFVLERTTWNGNRWYHPSQKTKETSNKASGNSADINLLLCNLLTRAGLDANPVLISTRDNGQAVFEYPILDQFNHTIVMLVIKDAVFLLDATDPHQPFNMIPYDCMSGHGLVLDKKGARKVTLDNQIAFHEQDIVSVSWDEAQKSFVAKGMCNMKGFAAVAFRKGYAEKGDDFIKKNIGSSLEDIVIVKDDIELGTFSFTFSLPLESADGYDKIYLPAIFVSRKLENPLKQPQRTYPIDYAYRTSTDYRFSMNLPEGYRVGSVPENLSVTLSNKQASYLYIAQYSDATKTMQVMQKFVVAVPVMEPDVYPELRQMYENMTAKHNEAIVIERVNK